MSARPLATVFAFLGISSAALAADPAASLVHVSRHGLVRVAPDQVVVDLGESQRPFVTSVMPVIGSAKPRSPQPGAFQVARDVRRVPKLKFVAFQPVDEDAKAEEKGFALGMIEITADVDIDFELAE